ncbi:MAG TPA: hypothetical protein HPP76_01720 [Desulfuromonadales bacterium]|nr:hypothetical protein [Desulfuromonadales bacterium]
MKRMIMWIAVLLVFSTIAVALAEPGNFAGTWNINCNSYTGRMVINGDSGNYSGRMFLQGKWEDMLDLTVEGNRINFRRATADQMYWGKISGTMIHGVFNQGGKGKYQWKAHQRGAN